MKYRLLSLTIAGLLSTQASAAGFQLAENSATGLGRAYSGETAIADNASVQSHNPALLTALEGRQLSVGVVRVAPSVTEYGHISMDLGGGAKALPDFESRGVIPDAYLPNFYYSHKLDAHWAYGLAINSNFGLQSELATGAGGQATDSMYTKMTRGASAILGSKSKVETYELNPNVAYAVNDQLSFGAGLRVIYAKGEVTATTPSWLNNLMTMDNLPEVYPAGSKLKSIKGDDVAFAYQLGMTWQPVAGHSVGLSYHSAIDLGLSGTATGALYKTMGALGDASMDVTLPGFAELATQNALTDNWSMSASVKWTNWSKFKQLAPVVATANGSVTDLLKQENFVDNWRFGLGTDYRINSVFTVRGGVAFDQSAVTDEFRTITIPDSDRMWYSAGFTYTPTKRLSVDFGLSYVQGVGSAPISETQALPRIGTNGPIPVATYVGEATSHVWLSGLQVSYKI